MSGAVDAVVSSLEDISGATSLSEALDIGEARLVVVEEVARSGWRSTRFQQELAYDGEWLPIVDGDLGLMWASEVAEPSTTSELPTRIRAVSARLVHFERPSPASSSAPPLVAGGAVSDELRLEILGRHVRGTFEALDWERRVLLPTQSQDGRQPVLVAAREIRFLDADGAPWQVTVAEQDGRELLRQRLDMQADVEVRVHSPRQSGPETRELTLERTAAGRITLRSDHASIVPAFGEPPEEVEEAQLVERSPSEVTTTLGWLERFWNQVNEEGPAVLRAPLRQFEVRFEPAEDNAWVIPSQHLMLFGRVGASRQSGWTGRGYGEFPEVVIHELGHYQVWRLEPDLEYECQTGAINEGLADLLSAAWLDSPDLLPTNRSVTSPLSFKPAQQGECDPGWDRGAVHDQGNLLAALLWSWGTAENADGPTMSRAELVQVAFGALAVPGVPGSFEDYIWDVIAWLDPGGSLHGELPAAVQRLLELARENDLPLSDFSDVEWRDDVEASLAWDERAMYLTAEVSGLEAAQVDHQVIRLRAAEATGGTILQTADLPDRISWTGRVDGTRLAVRLGPRTCDATTARFHRGSWTVDKWAVEDKFGRRLGIADSDKSEFEFNWPDTVGPEVALYSDGRKLGQTVGANELGGELRVVATDGGRWPTRRLDFVDLGCRACTLTEQSAAAEDACSLDATAPDISRGSRWNCSVVAAASFT